MAQALYVNGVDIVRGALDSEKEGQAARARWISRWRPQGEKSYSEDGRKWHEVYHMNFHEGPWSEGATKNREVIKAAQHAAHTIERICGHPKNYAPLLVAEAEEWVACYAVYRATIPDGCNRYYHFYTFVYVSIYRAMRQME